MLSDFIEKTRDVSYGPLPCAFWVADAVRHETGFDPIADLRDQSMGWAECRNMLITVGGLLRLVEPRMRNTCLTDLDGDGVAVLALDGRQMCGLILDGRAVVRLKSGLRVADKYTVLRGWSWSSH